MKNKLKHKKNKLIKKIKKEGRRRNRREGHPFSDKKYF
jgi:hypothetical protein